MAEDTDQQLVDRVLSGNKNAFNLLVLRYQHRVAALIGRFVHDHHEVEDVCQEAFIKAWSGANYGGEAALRHVDLREIEVANDRHGRPSLCLTGAVARAVSAAYPTYRIHLSMSHDGPLATAFVILERD